MTVADLPPPTKFKTYGNAILVYTRKGYKPGNSHMYHLRWPAGVRVRVEASSNDFVPVLFAKPRFKSMRAAGTEGKPAVLEFVTEKEQVYKLRVSSKGRHASGDYTLVVGPPPIEDVEVPEAPPSNEERLAIILENSEPDPKFGIPIRDRDKAIEEAVKDFRLQGKPVQGSLDTFTPLAFEVEEGYCYRLTLALDKDARWSELARRGLLSRLELPGGRESHPRVEAQGPGAVLEHFCPTESGTARVDLVARIVQHGKHKHELGKGSFDARVFRKVNSPFLYSSADLRQLIREKTRGFRRAGRSVRGRLDDFQPVQFRLERGRCYQLVLTLDKDAAFSRDARKSRVGFRLKSEHESINAGPGIHGPGGVADAGCPFESAQYNFDLVMFTNKQDALLGQGGYKLQLYSKGISAARLKQLQRESREQLRASDREHERFMREHCKKCREKYGHDKNAFENCAAQWGDRRDCY